MEFGRDSASPEAGEVITALGAEGPTGSVGASSPHAVIASRKKSEVERRVLFVMRVVSMFNKMVKY